MKVSKFELLALKFHLSSHSMSLLYQAVVCYLYRRAFPHSLEISHTPCQHQAVIANMCFFSVAHALARVLETMCSSFEIL